jgi:endonuclease/exonuclease/phosphatase family metal-dependent hydrolase
MTFNIQHGIDGGERYRPQTAIDTIARVNPDLVALQEITRNHPSYNCDDQPAAIANGLSAQTGKRWTAIYKEQWFTPDRSCQQSGRGDAAETEGLAFLAAESLGSPSFVALWNGGLGLATRTASFADIPIVGTHLAAQASGASDRMRQMSALLPWVETLGAPRVLVGDFNALAQSPELQSTFATYSDAWADALRAGTARGRLDGVTHKFDRIDFIFYTPSPRLQLQWAETVDTVALVGREASDHRPVVASFAVR